MTRKNLFRILATLLLLSVNKHAVVAQQSATEIYQQIKKLNVLGSVLYIAAHPDDENNTLLPFLAKEKMYRTAYLSLTRGDGGQNLIGEEQGIELGMIRTQELIAARMVDGCEQYFTRAYEFGYSKSVEETFTIWNKQQVLYDAVYIIRKFQPDIIIARFPPDKRAGHGHHTASAIIAHEAFLAAADSTVFPEQLKHGITTWQAKRLLWNTYNFGNNNTTANNQLKLEVGSFNALLGKSYGEIGGEARTMHKSQGEGRPRRKGSITEYFAHVAGDSASTDIMEGVNTQWNRVGLSSNTNVINQIIKSYSFEDPSTSVSALVKVYQQVKGLPFSIWQQQKLKELQAVIEAASGLFIEATTAKEQIVQGDSVKVNFFTNNRSKLPISVKQIQLHQFDTSISNILKPNSNYSFNKTLLVSKNFPVSQPYWLAKDAQEGMFVVDNDSLLMQPDNLHCLFAQFTLSIAGEDFIFTKPLLFKTVHPVRGEIYQPVSIVPSTNIQFSQENYIILNNKPVTPKLITKSNSSFTAQENSVDFSIDSLLQQSFSKKRITAAGLGKQTITYDHIPQLTWFKRAEAIVVKVNANVKGKYIGYVAGAGDKLPEALEGLGFTVEYLTEKNFHSNYLKKFDAIVMGIRAYNLYEFLTQKNEELNQYIAQGGNVIVQYLRSSVVNNKPIKVGPYTFSVSPQLRITNEKAAVKFLLPQHPLLNYPNKITLQDFEDWVQERSTYQVDKADAKMQKLIAMHDEGEVDTDGSLVISRYGKGNFVYCGLTLFRQLPAGVNGAYRLLANMIALPKNK